MPDIKPTEMHLPLDILIFNLDKVTEAIDDAEGTPRIQNLNDIKSQGYSLKDFLDDETIQINEPVETVEVPVLTAVGPKVRRVFQLRGAEEITVPLNAFRYGIMALMLGFDPETSVIDNAEIKLEQAGYDAQGEPDATYDGLVTMVNRLETIESINFGFLAQIVPEDEDAGESYILCPKVTVSQEEINHIIQKEYYQHELNLMSVILDAHELERWQNIFPAVKRTIGVYRFNARLEV